MAAKGLINQYITGWKEGNLSKITDTLSDNCLIIESHGSIYKGIKEVKKWVENWNKIGSKVNNWNITSFYETSEVVVFEWNFSCTVEGKNHNLDGITLTKIENGKIEYLREYRTTKPLHKEIISEV